MASWQHAIANLRLEAKTRCEQARDNAGHHATELERKSADVGRKLQDAGLHAWAGVKAGLDMALDDLREGGRSARDSFREDG